jgi:hypothetical protein
VTTQDATPAAPVAVRPQWLPEPKLPLESLENITVPEGALPPNVSETVAVHVVDWPTATDDGEHEAEMDVGEVAPAEPVNTYAAPC